MGMGTEIVTVVGGALAMTPEARVLRCRGFLVMNKEALRSCAPALNLRHNSSLAVRKLVRTPPPHSLSILRFLLLLLA
jgi:hypothetical protein